MYVQKYDNETKFGLKPCLKFIVLSCTMKTMTILTAFLSLLIFDRQQREVSKGEIIGIRPDTTSIIQASKLEAGMDEKVRITTSLRGKVIKVIKSQGGWFDIDGGNGKVIAAHFKDYKVSVPKSLAGHYILANGIAAKEFAADDLQHYAGDTVTGKKGHNVKTNPNRRLTFEVTGLRVE